MLRKKKIIAYTFVKLSRPRAAILERKERKKRYVSPGGSKYRVDDNFEVTCSVPQGQILSNEHELLNREICIISMLLHS